MISIVISSANSTLLSQVTKNIEDTILVPFEIISFENGSGEKGICEIYNTGARRAKYDIICFMHEDINIKTMGWGAVVLSYFKNNLQLGLLGVAGCSYKSKSPSGWVCYGSPKILHYNLLQSFKHRNKKTEHQCLNPNNEILPKVASVDGLWFCTRKSIAEEYPFDEQLLKGFHGYDIDFSLSVNQKYDVAITYEILINHFSEGRFKEDWITETLKVTNKWKDHLPVNIAGLSKKERVKVEIKTYENLLKRMHRNGFSFSGCWGLISKGFYTESEFFIKFKLYLYLIKNRSRLQN